MFRPTVRIVNAENVRRHLLDPSWWSKPVADALRDAVREGQDVAQRGAGDSIGRTIQSEAHGLQGAVYSLSAAALPVEVGRRPGAPPPPPGVIAAWAARRGITARPYVIARAISRRGIAGRFFMRAARQHMERRLPSVLGRAAGEIERRWRS